MATAKEHMIHILQEQPDDSSYDDLLREIIFARMVERGLQDSDNGRVIDSEEVARQIASWAK
jgi:predicted transcriptional regulator